jgi:catechol 2,3-dioxygenase-like lactoylglutathione lyase family enzyme
MIPLLPCRSIDDQIDFYEALGFEVTYRQKVPNAFAAVQRGAIELQFFTLKGYEPANSYSTCYVMASNVDELYADFRAGLKQALGRVPSRGIPRIGAIGDMSYGVRQFLMTDPGGNIIRIGQPLEQTEAANTKPLPRLERALEAARLLLYSKVDPETTARVIDDALAATPDASKVLRVQARILRADAAHAMGDDALTRALLDEAAGIELGAADQARIADDLTRAEELRGSLA